MKLTKNYKNQRIEKMIRRRYKCSYCQKIFKNKEIYELSKCDLFKNEKIKRVFICSKCLVQENESLEREQNGY